MEKRGFSDSQQEEGRQRRAGEGCEEAAGQEELRNDRQEVSDGRKCRTKRIRKNRVLFIRKEDKVELAKASRS